MKKCIVLVLGIFLCFGCSFLEEKSSGTMTCKLSTTSTTGNLESTYEAKYKDNIIETVNTVESLESDNTSYLQLMKESYDQLYESYNSSYGGYTYEITLEDTVLVSKVSIDYSKVDLALMGENESGVSTLLNSDNKIEISTLKVAYEALGATCTIEKES